MLSRQRITAANSSYKKLAMQWLNKVLCFVASSVLADSLVLRNRQLLIAAKRYGQCQQNRQAMMKRLLTYSILLLVLSCGRKPYNKEPIGLFPIKEFGKWGYINSNGKTVIKCQFDDAGEFSEGLAKIRKDTLFGFIDTTGKIIIEPQFYQAAYFSDGLCNITIKKDTTFQYGFIKKDGSVAFTTSYEDASFYSNGRALVEINDEVCFIDKSGKVVINTHFPYGSSFHEGIAMVWTGDSSKYIDTTGKIIAAFPEMGNDDFSEGLARVRSGDKCFYIDKTGKPKINLKNTELTYFSFSNGMAKAVIAGSDHKAGFIDTTGKIVIPITYHDIKDFKEGLAAYRDKESWGFIDKKGKVVIKPQFEEVEFKSFVNGLCRAKQNHQWGYINHKGEFVWKEQVGLQYTKLDLLKWKLDTLIIDKPLYADRYAGRDNYPRKKNFTSLSELTLKVDTIDLTVFADKYFAYKLYLINASKDTIKIPAQDGRIKIIQQARNKNGEWQDIENFYNSWCGNSYYTLRLKPNEFQIFSTPIFKGEFTTQLRFKLELDRQVIYSNYYTSQINFGQLLNPKDKDKTGIAVWTN
jgi:hypothetical protein